MKKLWFSYGVFTLLLFATIWSCDPKNENTDLLPPKKSSTLSYGFEDWTYDNVGWFDNGEGKFEPFEGKEKYYETNSAIYVTLNNLYSLEGGGLPPGPLTAFRDTGKEGQYAVKLVSNNFPLGDSAVFIPGVIGTVKVNLSAFAGDIKKLALFGTPYTGTHNRLSFWYKYEPVGGDSAQVYVETSKTTNGQRVSLKRAKTIFNTAESEWKECKLDLDSFNDGIPDSIIVLFVSSAKFDFENLFGCEGQQNSTLWVDDIKFYN